MAGSGIRTNADGKADYVNGITPDYKLNERGLISPLLPLGDENELMLKNTLSLITTGTMPDAEKPEETETQSAKVLLQLTQQKENKRGTVTLKTKKIHSAKQNKVRQVLFSQITIKNLT